MSPFTSFSTSAVRPDQLSAIAADFLVLEHVRVFRRLLVVRCSMIALAIATAGALLGLLHSFAYWFSVGLFIAAPACAWTVERRRERQLSRTIEHLPGSVTDVVAPKAW